MKESIKKLKEKNVNFLIFDFIMKNMKKKIYVIKINLKLIYFQII